MTSPISPSPFPPRASLLLLGAICMSALCATTGCTIEDVTDEIEVVESVPPPGGPGATHRLSRDLGLGGDSSRVDRGEFTFVRLRVLGPEGADLFNFSRIEIYVRTPDGRFALAEGNDFTDGETERELEVRFTDNITPLLADEDLSIEWDIYYRTNVPYPSTPIQLETVVGVSVDVRIL